jgi:hypothetical protein
MKYMLLLYCEPGTGPALDSPEHGLVRGSTSSPASP